MRFARSPERLTRLLVLVLLGVPTLARAEVIHVDVDAPGIADGSSWVDAYTDLAVARGAASPGDSVWVAEGTYKPTAGTDRAASFELGDVAGVLGGFQGTENSPGDRVPGMAETLLSGDIGTPGDSTDNSYRVVNAGLTPVVLDGLTIAYGNANGTPPSDTGAGINVAAGGDLDLIQVIVRNHTSTLGASGIATGGNVDVSLTDCQVLDNDGPGAAGLNVPVGGNLTAVRVLFRGNRATGFGGAMRITGGGVLTMTDVTFENNLGASGGALNIWDGDNTLTNVRFTGNTAISGGGIFIQSISETAQLRLDNVLFESNAGQGGAVYADNASVDMTNGTISGNKSGVAVFSQTASTFTFHNTVACGNDTTPAFQMNGPSTASYSHCLIEGSGGSGGGWNSLLGNDLGNNLDADPLFVDPGSGDFRLTAGSPARDSGNNAAPNLPLTDLDGDPRVYGGIADMGVYEFSYPCQSTVFVDADAAGPGNGTSWVEALPDLQEGLLAAGECGAGVEVWVAEGTYRPTPGSDREATFGLLDGVEVYGGFNGTEATRDQRHPETFETILSGDIGAPGDSTDNSYHVVTAVNVGPTAVLDGVTVTGGNADGASVDANGGGVFGSDAGPTLSGLVVRNNAATGYGGGLCLLGVATAVITRSTVTSNTAQFGGGMYKQAATLTLDQVRFLANEASLYGGGLYAGASENTILNCEFSYNQASELGGGLYLFSPSPGFVNAEFSNNSAGVNGGGAYLFTGAPDVVNSTFVGNTAGTRGGAIYNRSAGTILNAILHGNTALSGGDQIYNFGGIVTVSHSLVQGSGGSGGGWDPTVGTDGGNNLDADPLLVDPGTQNHRLTLASPAVDAGVPVAGLPTVDLDGSPRVSGAAIDLGAYEYDLGLTFQSIVDVGNDQGRSVRIVFDASTLDSPTPPTIVQYEAFRRVDPLPGSSFMIDARERGMLSSASVLDSGWEFVSAIPAHGAPDYSLVASTLADSTISQGQHWSVFFIRAATGDPLVFYDSVADSGYSVDNLVPSIPTGMMTAGPLLSWNPSEETDWRHYSVYGSETGIRDGSEVLIQTTTTEGFDLTGHTASYILVTATDHSGNESGPAVLANPTGLPGGGAPSTPSLRAAWPNPVRSATAIAFDLPEEGRVRLRIFDARGRLVRTLVDRDLPAGRHMRTWSGETDAGTRAPAGIYFTRYETAIFRQARKLVLTR